MSFQMKKSARVEQLEEAIPIETLFKHGNPLFSFVAQLALTLLRCLVLSQDVHDRGEMGLYVMCSLTPANNHTFKLGFSCPEI